jgi:hypothetical protein
MLGAFTVPSTAMAVFCFSCSKSPKSCKVYSLTPPPNLNPATRVRGQMLEFLCQHGLFTASGSHDEAQKSNFNTYRVSRPSVFINLPLFIHTNVREALNVLTWPSSAQCQKINAVGTALLKTFPSVYRAGSIN